MKIYKSKFTTSLLGFFVAVTFAFFLGDAIYFGWARTTPHLPYELTLSGCEVLHEKSDQIDVVAKSLTPKITIKDTDAKTNLLRIRFLNLSHQHELVGLHEKDKLKILHNRNGIEVKIELGPDEERTLSAKPKKQEYPFEFAVFGDSEGNDNPFTNKHGSYFVWNRLTDEIKKDNLLFAVGLGDLLSSGEEHHWKRFGKRINLLSASFFPILGNEDIDPPSGRHQFRMLFGKENYSFSYLDCHFIFIDNSNKKITPDQWTWIESELLNNQDKRQFLFMHIPPFHPNNLSYYMEGWDTQTTAQFMSLVKKAKVEAILGAHLHSFSYGEIDGIKFFISGGAGGKLDSLDPGYHFVKIRLEKDKPLKFDVIPLSNKPKLISWALSLLDIK